MIDDAAHVQVVGMVVLGSTLENRPSLLLVLGFDGFFASKLPTFLESAVLAGNLSSLITHHGT